MPSAVNVMLKLSNSPDCTLKCEFIAIRAARIVSNHQLFKTPGFLYLLVTFLSFFILLLKEPLILKRKGINIGFLGYCDHVPDFPNCTAMRSLYKSGPAVYRDDIATRDVKKLKKVSRKYIIITVACIKQVVACYAVTCT